MSPPAADGLDPNAYSLQDSFNATMDPKKDMPGESSCTSCQLVDDFSNYWTAVLYFKAQNGTYKRVPQLGNNQFEKAKGGLTVYYMQDAIYTSSQTSKVQAFQPVSAPSQSRSDAVFQQDNPHRASACSSETSTRRRSQKPPASGS